MYKTALFSHPDCLAHRAGPDHPECPGRLRAIDDRLIAAGLFDLLLHRDAERASREQLERVHQGEYVQRIFDSAPGEGLVSLDPDTFMSAGTLDAALRAAGAVVGAVDMVMAGEADKAFCSIRPPGHHAEADRAMGFCLFNNVAVGAAHALAVHELERVAIIDFDVHYGNGTAHTFADDPRVMICSTYQSGLFPPLDPPYRATRDIHEALPAVGYAREFRARVSDDWVPGLKEFAPQLMMISAGFDAHVEDDMGHADMVDADYEWVTRQLVNVAAASDAGRIVSVLEGGYALSALGRSAACHVRALMGL